MLRVLPLRISFARFILHFFANDKRLSPVCSLNRRLKKTFTVPECIADFINPYKLSDDDFRNTIKYGIAKVNIFTNLCLDGVEEMNKGRKKKLSYLEIRNLKVERESRP